jgi:hypothetical protein
MATALSQRLDYLFQTCHCNSGNNVDALPTEQLPFTNKIHTYVLASLMGCYFLACLVLTKMMLPEAFRAEFSAALGGKGMFQIRTCNVNAAFAVSAIVSTITLGTLLGIQRQNTHRYTTKTDEDTFLNLLDP